MIWKVTCTMMMLLMVSCAAIEMKLGWRWWMTFDLLMAWYWAYLLHKAIQKETP